MSLWVDIVQYVVLHSIVCPNAWSGHTDICKRSLENHFLDLDLNGIVLLYIGVKGLVRNLTVYTE
jgi:hypothetical protein